MVEWWSGEEWGGGGVRGDDGNDKQEGRKAGGQMEGKVVNGEGEAFHLILQLVSLQVCQSIPCPVLQLVASHEGDHPRVLVLLPPSSNVNTYLVLPERGGGGEKGRERREGRGRKGEEGRERTEGGGGKGEQGKGEE